MPALHDFLARFRPAGSPGAAARAAVPADAARELEEELGPVLALLADADAERGRIIAGAQGDADQVIAGAHAQATAIAADADRRARAARDEAARRAVALAKDAGAAAVDGATRQAGRIGELAGQRRPALVSRAVESIRQLGADGSARSGADGP